MRPRWHAIDLWPIGLPGHLDAARELHATLNFATLLLTVGDQTVLGYRPEALTAAPSPHGE